MPFCWSATIAQAQSPALITGDSLTSGLYATTENRGYAILVAAWLQHYGYTTSILPASKVGAALLSLPSMQAVAPDLVVIELGTNDFSTPASQFERDYRHLVAGLRQARPGCVLIVLGLWKQQPVRAIYDEVIARLADEYAATYVSLETLSDDPGLAGPAGVATPFGISDGWHPNDAGHAAIAAAVENAVRWQCTVTLNDGNGFTRSRDVRVTIAARDRLSAITGMRRSIDGGPWSTWRPLKATWNWRLSAGDGRKVLALQFRDVEGVVSRRVTSAITLDTHGPVTRALAPVAAARGRSVPLRYRVDEALSPKVRVTIIVRSPSGGVARRLPQGMRSTGRDHVATVVAPAKSGSYRYVVTATDLAGNRQSVAGANILVVR